MKNKIIHLFLLLTFSATVFGQVGINTQTPTATFQVVHKSGASVPAGIIAPRITGEDLKSADGDYTADQDGAIVYVTQAVITPSSKTKNVTREGYYSYNANDEIWVAFGALAEPWYTVADNTSATSNTDDIYQTGKVAVGSSDIHSSAIFQVNSSTKGILTPQLTASERAAISSPADGLLIYNTSTHCYNYYTSLSSKWLSICGEEDPAVFSVVNCTNAGPQGTYTQGTSLNSSNTYTIDVNITQAGPYTILATTGNGYSFSKSGTFTSTGTQTVVLEGQGTPSTGPTTNTITLVFNGATSTPSCTLPGITVNGGTTSFTVDCSTATVSGTYLQGVAVDGTQYIDVPVSTVTTPGSAVVETQLVNGIQFSSGSINITASTTSIRLYAQGTPTSTGTFSYSFTAPGSTTCTGVNVTVTSALGTFSYPADRCLQILQANPSSVDGEYFIKGVNGAAVKTYCDMTNGGYTLIQSYSEKALLTDADTNLRGNQNLNWNGDKNYTAATSASGTVTYRNFLLPLSVRQSVRSNTTGNLYRVRIVEDAANLHNNNDTWANNNYAIFDLSTAGSYDFIGNGGWAIDRVKVTSKLFGKDYAVTGTSSGNYVTFDGVSWNYAYTYNTSTARVISHQSTPPDHPFTYSNTNGTTTTSNLTALDDIWGSYGDSTFNHHIGKCKATNSTSGAIGDDYQGLTECTGSYYTTYRTPHSFNDGEGRYIQWFVK